LLDERERHNNMNSSKFVLGILVLSTAVLSAQEAYTPRYEVGLNYSGVHVNAANGSESGNGNGGSGYFEYNLTNSLGLVGDFGGYANTRSSINEKLLTYMFGPRWNWRHSRLTPYTQALFGGGYAWNASVNTQNAFAFAVGGGLDYRLTDRFAIKPVQVEYLLTDFNSAQLGGATRSFGGHQNDIRYSAGVVLRFGSK
jgi:opacity protein-like surface antigen